MSQLSKYFKTLDNFSIVLNCLGQLLHHAIWTFFFLNVENNQVIDQVREVFYIKRVFGLDWLFGACENVTELLLWLDYGVLQQLLLNVAQQDWKRRLKSAGLRILLSLVTWWSLNLRHLSILPLNSIWLVWMEFLLSFVIVYLMSCDGLSFLYFVMIADLDSIV